MLPLIKLFRLNKNKLSYLVLNLCFIIIFGIVYWIYGTNEHFKNMAQQDKKKLTMIDALYLSAITHCTLGYGDIVPISDSMKLVTIIHTILMISYLFLVSL